WRRLRGNCTFQFFLYPLDATRTRSLLPSATHSTTTPLLASRVVSTTVVSATATDLGALISFVLGTVPASAALTAASLASRQARVRFAVTMYRRPSWYGIDSAEPQPVPIFHSRVPFESKQ